MPSYFWILLSVLVTLYGVLIATMITVLWRNRNDW